MGKQLKKGTQFPLRPAVLTISLTGDYAMINDPDPVDWSAAATSISGQQADSEFMDDGGWITVGTLTHTLRAGIYKFTLQPFVKNAAGTAETFQLAIANAGGGTVHFSTPDIGVASNANLPVNIQHVQAFTTDVSVTFRAAQTTAGTDLSIDAGKVALIERIGNADEQ